MAAPTLTGLTPYVLFDENLVNATPQLLDADVTFDDPDGDFDGGVLTLSGLLAEDVVSVRNQGAGAGQIGLSGSDITFGGVVIGTLAGGAGATLTITFNAAASAAAIDALIQNLTHANLSDTPTASRELVLTLTDASGAGIGPAPGTASFVGQTGSSNPFDGIDAGYSSSPAFVDLDGDGDGDLVLGDNYGYLRTYRNDDEVFVQLAGAANPFAAVSAPGYARPAFADLDGDGDLDLVVGREDGLLQAFENDAGIFTELVGAANPFDGLDLGNWSAPTFGDIDGDGDDDLVVSSASGAIRLFSNEGGVFVASAEDTFADVSTYAAATLADIDGDGDLDLVVGTVDGDLVTYLNTPPHERRITVRSPPATTRRPWPTSKPRSWSGRTTSTKPPCCWTTTSPSPTRRTTSTAAP